MVPSAWKDADGEAATREFFAHPSRRRAAIRELMAELLSEKPFPCRCAADLARRISAREPGVLGRHAGVLIDLAFTLPEEQWQARGYTTLAAALNASNRDQRLKLANLVRAMARDHRIALRAIAVEALVILAVAEPALRDEAALLLEQSRFDSAAAVRMRARRMLLPLLAADRPVPPGQRIQKPEFRT